MRGDEPDRGLKPEMRGFPGPGLNCFSCPEIGDGLWAYSALMASAFEGAMSLWWPWGLSGTGLAVKPCEAKEDAEPCDPGVPLRDM